MRTPRGVRDAGWVEYEPQSLDPALVCIHSFVASELAPFFSYRRFASITELKIPFFVLFAHIVHRYYALLRYNTVWYIIASTPRLFNIS